MSLIRVQILYLKDYQVFLNLFNNYEERETESSPNNVKKIEEKFKNSGSVQSKLNGIKTVVDTGNIY